MAGSLLPQPKQIAFDSAFNPGIAYQFYTYDVGTLTPKQTYQDAALAIANTNPVVANGRGEVVMYGTGTYRIILKDALGSTIWDRDNVDTLVSSAAIGGATGAALIGYDGATLDVYLKAKNSKVVSSIGALRAIDKTKNTQAFVTGYYAAGDGGGGAYYYDAADVATADNGGTVIVGSDGGRWKLVADGPVYVEQFGAKPGATVDATAAFQAAVNALPVVYCRSASYLIAGSVMMPYGVKIIGESKHGTIRPNPGQVVLGFGTIINVTSTTVSPFIYYSGNSFIGLTFYYPNQLRTSGTPTVYPPTFTFNAAGASEVLTNNLWQDCQAVNAYRWINAMVGHLDFEFSSLEGCILYRGIETDGCGGTDFFKNIRFSYYYFCALADPISTYIQANAQGITVGRSDAFHMDRVYVGSMNVGIRFFKGAVNTLGGPYGSITGLSLDSNNYGIYSEATHPVGVNIADMMSNNLLQDIEIPSLSPDATIIQVSGFKLWGGKTNGVRVNKANCSVKLTNGEIYSFTNAGVSVGYAGCDLQISNVKFANAGTVAPVAILAALNSLILTDNFFNGTPALFTSAPAYTQILGNAGYNEVIKTIASATTIDVSGAGDVLKVSGTTSVTGISGGWIGRRITLQSSTGSITYGIGVNIVGGKTVATGEAITFVYDGANWFPTR